MPIRQKKYLFLGIAAVLVVYMMLSSDRPDGLNKKVRVIATLGSEFVGTKVWCAGGIRARALRAEFNWPHVLTSNYYGRSMLTCNGVFYMWYDVATKKKKRVHLNQDKEYLYAVPSGDFIAYFAGNIQLYNVNDKSTVVIGRSTEFPVLFADGDFVYWQDWAGEEYARVPVLHRYNTRTRTDEAFTGITNVTSTHGNYGVYTELKDPRKYPLTTHTKLYLYDFAARQKTLIYENERGNVYLPKISDTLVAWRDIGDDSGKSVIKYYSLDDKKVRIAKSVEIDGPVWVDGSRIFYQPRKNLDSCVESFDVRTSETAEVACSDWLNGWLSVSAGKLLLGNKYVIEP